MKWCIWLAEALPSEIRASEELQKRISNVKELRSKSSREATRKLALTPTLFGEIRQPKNNYIFIPLTSSENRSVIPMGFFEPDFIANNTGSVIANASLFHFGILQSKMHMTWVSHVCGRLKSDYRYSNEIVYNNYPWPENPSAKHIANIEKAAQEVLDAREKFPQSSLADLYDPLTMPPVLLKAHQNLDKAVDAAYSSKTFKTETERMEFLFGLYGELVNNN
jgi:hypothetical protein